MRAVSILSRSDELFPCTYFFFTQFMVIGKIEIKGELKRRLKGRLRRELRRELKNPLTLI